MSVRLVEKGSGSVPTREIPIHGDEFLLGRGNDCDLRLHDANVSRHHCLIRVRPRETVLADLGSINGTFVNGQRVRSQTPLHTGDEVVVGGYHFLVDLGDGRDDLVSDVAGVSPQAPTIRLKGSDAG